MPAEDREDWDLCKKDDPEKRDCTLIHMLDKEYRHANTYEEVQQVLNLGKEKVRDCDGDEVVDIEINQYNEMRYKYIDSERDQEDSVSLDYPSELLIRFDARPVTDEEMAEVIASLASVTTTQQHNV